MLLTVLGDALLDRDEIGLVERVAPDAPVPVVESVERLDRPGGAGLAALLAAAGGCEVTLITALGADEPGELVRRMLDQAGITTIDLRCAGLTAEKIRVRCGRQSLLRLDRGGPPGDIGAPGPDAAAALACADGVLVADYGRGLTNQQAVRALLADIAPAKPLVWDPHPRGARPVAGAAMVTPNAREARGFAREFEQQRAHLYRDQAPRHEPRSAVGVVAADAAILRRSWYARAVTVTRGAEGAVLAGPSGSPVVISCSPEVDVDTCGAGDRFAGALLDALCRRSTAEEAVRFAVDAASAYVSAGGVSVLAVPRPSVHGRSDGTPPGGGTSLAAAASRAEKVRRAGGAVVVAGGCFDLLHPGHVRLLTEAGRLGDLLIVLLNGDASVRRLKGPGRPIQPAADRAAVLSALDAVDLVVVFEEDTPIDALRVLQPDLFVKGGDYASTDLPEARLLESWGGQVVVLPYVAGHSTTRLVEEVNARAF